MSEEYTKNNPEITKSDERTEDNLSGAEILADLPDDFDDFRVQQDASVKNRNTQRK